MASQHPRKTRPGRQRAASQAPSSARPRYPVVDVLRGFAIALMVAFHYAFDLSYFGVVRIDFYHDPFWLNLRTLIVTLFLFIVGVSLVLAHRNGINWRRYARRLAHLFAGAILVSVGSYALFPGSMIFFGVLHFIFLASLLGLLVVQLRWSNLVAGSLLVLVGVTIQHPLFDQPWLQWFGLMTHKPVTEDYVPLLPWFGVVMIGMFFGRRALLERPLPALSGYQPAGGMARLLALAGRHGLLLYLLHQPVLLGLVYLGVRLG